MFVTSGLLMAAVVAAAPEVRDHQVATADMAPETLLASALQPGAQPPVLVALQPSHLPGEMILQALPSAPDIVKRTSYFGVVTIDHRAHLARRTTCKACHGPSQVGKIDFTPRLAHERCVGCHRMEARGPTDCKGCHVKPEPPAEAPATVTAEATEKAPAAPAAAPPGAAHGKAGLAAASPSALEDERPHLLRRVVQVGYAAGEAFGPALRLSSRHDGIAIEHSIDLLTGAGQARTVFLIGGGVVHRLRDRVDLIAVGVGGIDAVQKPEMGVMPALGARLGVEWVPSRGFLSSVQLSVTGMVDVARRQAMGREIGGTNFYATLATGFSLNKQ